MGKSSPRIWLLVLWIFVYALAAAFMLQQEGALPSRVSKIDFTDFVIATLHGDICIRLFDKEAPNSTRFVRAFAAAVTVGVVSTSTLVIPCAGCKFYRAEPVPEFWGSEILPNSSFGGRWGPPYALLQGQLGPSGPKVP